MNNKLCFVCQKSQPLLHKMPAREPTRSKWVNVLNLKPEHNFDLVRVCSDHFLDLDYLHKANKKTNRLLLFAYPHVQLPCTNEIKMEIQDTEIYEPEGLHVETPNIENKKHNEAVHVEIKVEDNSEDDSDIDLPMSSTSNKFQFTHAEQLTEIRNLKRIINKLKTRIRARDFEIKQLKAKAKLTNPMRDNMLTYIPTGIKDAILKDMHSGSDYTHEMRMFSTTLYSCSSLAYTYFRKVWNGIFPHPQTVQRWCITYHEEMNETIEVLKNEERSINQWKFEESTLESGSDINTNIPVEVNIKAEPAEPEDAEVDEEMSGDGDDTVVGHSKTSNDTLRLSGKHFLSHYAEPEVTGDSTPAAISEDYAERRKQFLLLLDTDYKRLEIDTRGQPQSAQWSAEVHKRLIASDFGEICKMRAYSAVTKAKAFLTINLRKSGANKYQKENERTASDAFAAIIGQPLLECGLYVNKKCPYLVASPLRITQDKRYLVEIKCPFKSMLFHPEEAFTTNKIDFGDIVGGEFVLKRSHRYFFQVQGQLEICDKEIAYFVVWSPKGMIYEKIKRDRIFWAEKMHIKLDEFYFNYFLPELLSLQMKKEPSSPS